uniref:Uncharacterized protein n=1 Tax=Rhodnius neglectus TaxID=72488 RepID=A0A0P4W0T9_9HEMI
MVQEEITFAYSSSFKSARTPEARKAGFEALNKYNNSKQTTTSKTEEKSKYGAWGPVYKNQQHFASLHNC